MTDNIDVGNTTIHEKNMDIIDTISNLIIQYRTEGYPEHLIDNLIKVQLETQAYKGLDHALIQVLKELSEIDKMPIYQKNQYSEVMKNIDNTSFVIFFKNAGLFKVYTPTILEQYLHGQIITTREFKKTSEIYEVVDRKRPQKIIIIIDGSIENELNKIREYIFTFFSKYADSLDKKDIVSFKNPITKNLEILVNGMYVKNYEDKELIISNLLSYIESEEQKIESSLDIGKIAPRRMCEIPNADIFLIPQKKDILDASALDIIHKYISDTSNCVLLNGSINIINVTNSIIGSNNKNNNIGTIIEIDNDKDDLQTFLNYIKDNKPAWYLEGKWIFISELYNKFQETCDSDITIANFSKNGIDVLFTKRETRRINKKQGRAVLLKKYKDL